MSTRKKSMKGYPDGSVHLQLTGADQLDLAGKKVVVVGGTDGLGRAIARLAAQRGAQVRVAGRTFRDAGLPNLTFQKADLSSMREAQRLGGELKADLPDVLVLTAGIMTAKQREVTAEGLERDLAVSYLSRLAVLRAALGPDAATRVFVMGFPGAGELGNPEDLNAESRYDAMAQHMNTVAGNEALVLDAARRYPKAHVFGLNPGLIKTNIRANYLGEGSLMHRAAELLIGLIGQSPDAYARRIVPLLFARELDGRTGLMFGAKANPILPTDGMDTRHVEELIRASEALLSRAQGVAPPA